LAFGLYERAVPPLTTATVPLAPWVIPVIVRVSPVSGAIESLARTFRVVVGLSSATENPSAFATGLSFTAVTVSVTVAVFEFAVPSLARKVNESGPL
jgi:hypothetical protein